MTKKNWDDVLTETNIAEWYNILEKAAALNSLKLQRIIFKKF